MKPCTVEKVLRTLNIFGAVALFALALYLGWAIVGGSDEEKAAIVAPATTLPASR